MKRVLLIAFILLALTGCTTDLKTSINVTSPTQANLSVAFRIDNELADEVRTDPTQEVAIKELIMRRSGNTPEKKDIKDEKENSITWVVDLPYQRVEPSAELLGFSSATLSPSGEDTSVDINLVVPQELIRAVTQANADDPDAAAVTATALALTQITIEVNFPGNVVSVITPEGTEIQRSERSVTLTQPLDKYKAGKMTVTGSTKRPLLSTTRLLILGGVILAITAFLIWRRRRA